MFSPATRAVIIALVGLTSIPGIILLSISGWPDIFQGMPIDETMQLYSENRLNLNMGFFFFVISGLLWAPGLWFIVDAVRRAGGHSDAMSFAVVLIGASLAVRVAWYGVSITMTPIAADLWATGDPTTQAAIDVILRLSNDMLSTLQEDIGVNLIGSTALLLVCIEIIRLRVFARWLGYFGAAASVCFFISSAELVGLDAGLFVAIAAPSLMNFWFLFMAIATWRKRHAKVDQDSSMASS